MTIYDAKINLVVEASSPDSYDPAFGLIPLDSFVVSRHRDGSVASTYGDLSWNRTAYDPENRTRFLNFKYWTKDYVTQKRANLAKELRWIMFLLLYLRSGNPLSNASLDGILVVIRCLARFCEARSIRLQDALASSDLMTEHICSTMKHASQLCSLLTFLRSLGSETVGFEVAERRTILAIRKRAKQLSEEIRQFPPIPTRIYSLILSNLSTELSDFEQAADRLLRLYADCQCDPFLGRDLSRQNVIRRKLRPKTHRVAPTFSALLHAYDLEHYFVSKSLPKSVLGLASALREAMLVASIQIQAFTGMRHDEVGTLPYDCLESVKRNGNTHHIIKGRVTKLSKGLVKQTQWVTSEAGCHAVFLAQRIAKVIYSSGAHPVRLDIPAEFSRFLFVAPQLRRTQSKSVPTVMHLNEYPNLRGRLQPEIADTDLCELEQIDPHRAWRSEESFQIGRPWTFTRHQLRRSLALYAQRSGLVSLPSLKRQLQHITLEMSHYYARGSAFARDFIGHDKRHFGREWQDTQPVSQFLSYAAHVLMTDDVLFGPHPNWIDSRLKDKDGIVVFDREITLKRFRQGQLAYRETPIGGCTNVDECDQHPSNILDIDCLTTHCKNIVGNLPKLERVIAAQTRRVEKLRLIDSRSPDCRAEESDLAVLVSTRDNVLKDKSRTTSTS